MADLSGMFGAIDAAIGQGAAPVPAPADADTSARPLTIRPGPSAQDTISAIDNVLSAPKGAPVTLATPIAGSAAAMPAGLTSGSALPPAPAAAPAQPDPPATRPPIAPSDQLGDIVQSGASGLESGELGLGSLPRTMHDAARYGADWAVGKLTGKTAAQVAADRTAYDQANDTTGPQAPSYDDLKSTLESVAGPMYQPKSTLGDYAHTIGEFLPGAGEGKLAATGAGVASEAAGQATQGTAFEPYARVGAALIAGPAAGAAVDAAGKVAMPIAAGTPGLKNLPAVQNYVDNAAGSALLKSSSDPAALRNFAAQPAAPDLVPGSPNTLAATVGNDPGLYQAEKAARNVDNTAFNAVDAAKSQAQTAALKGVQPTGDVFAPGQMIRSRLDALDQAAQDSEDALNAKTAANATARQTAQGNLAATQAGQADAALGQAQNAARAVGPVADPNALGADFRAAQTDALNTSKYGAGGTYAAPTGGTSALYKAIDPDGTLTTVVTPLKQAKQSISDAIDPFTGVQPQGPEAALWNTIDRLPDVVPFQSLQNLDARTTAAMKAVRLNPSDHDPQAISRLTQLKGAIKDNIASAGQAQADHEAGLVSQGLMQPDETMASRLQEQFGVPDRAVGQSATGSAGAADAVPGSGTPPSARAGGTVDAPQGRFGSASGGQGDAAQVGSQGLGQDRFTAPLFDDTAPTRAPQSPGVPRPQDLHGFVRSNGGMQDTGGDLSAMGLNNIIARPGQGLAPDAMREAAAQAGYLGADTSHAMANTSVNDLLDAVGSDRPVHAVQNENAAAAWSNYDQAKADYARARSESEGRSSGAMALPPKAPLSSYGVDDIYPPGMAPPPPAANGPLNLAPNWDDGAIGRKRAADAAYAEQAQTFKNKTVAPSFKTNGFAQQFDMPPAGILAKAFHQGPTGGSDLNAYLKSAGNDPRAVDAVTNFALNGLRSKVGPTGTLRQGDIDRWMTAHAPAAQALEAAKPGFMDGVKTAASAEKTLSDLGAAHKQAMAEHNATAAQQALADNAERTAGIKQARGVVKAAQQTPAGQFDRVAGNAVSHQEIENAVFNHLSNGRDGATRMRSLVQSVQSNPAALDGLRKAGVDAMVRNFTNADGSLSGAKLINFAKNNSDTLKELYPNDQVAMFGALARDAEAGAAWRTTTAIKGGSDTAKNLQAMVGKVKEHAVHGSMMFAAYEAISQGFEHGGIQGAALGGVGAATAYLVNSLRSAGVHRVSDLYREALADPALARLLISKMPDTANADRLHAVARLVRRGAIMAPMAARAGAQQ